jgi:DNA-binding NtrC family response regulator
VLVEGETGTGKELVAHAIHNLSARSARRFVAVNCGAIPDSLIEDELFGHARGAFTDAQQEHPGLLASADRGTFCLDEVSSLSPRAQGTLLRVLQDKSFRILGSTSERRSNVRFVALTNRPLWDLVRQGSFRADLYYRLCVLCLRLPPLRERAEDILPLAYHFLEKHGRSHQPVTAISAQVKAVLEEYDWPGNVRQLEHTMVRAAHLARATSVELEDVELPDTPPLDGGQHSAAGSFNALKRQTIESFERRYLTRVMQQCRGNITQAARIAGKDRRDLGKLLKKYEIQPKSFVGG